MNSPDDWNELLRNCDFEMTACEMRAMFRRWSEGEEDSKVEVPYYSPDFLEVLYPFLETPRLETAKSLLKVAPYAYPLFTKCSQGGAFYETNKLLSTVQPNSASELKHEPTYEQLAARVRELEEEADSMGIELPWKRVQPSSTASELKAAFLDSARPDSPAPPGWWVLPVLGIVMSLFLLWLNTAFGAICLVLASSFFGACWMRAKRNRPPRTPRTITSNAP